MIMPSSVSKTTTACGMDFSGVKAAAAVRAICICKDLRPQSFYQAKCEVVKESSGFRNKCVFMLGQALGRLYSAIHFRSPQMLFKTLSAAVFGIDANIIEVEVDVSTIKLDKDNFTTVGLPDAAVRESRERVRSALRNCGYDIPPTHITVNLAPADIKKEGSGFDLPMSIGILGAYGALIKKELPEFVLVGEFSLDGGL